jgi:O-acetylserine/cysteine efflux transporter
MKPVHILLALLVNICWGFNIVPVNLAIAELPPLTATLVRFVFVVLLLAPSLRWRSGAMLPVFLYSMIAGAASFGLNIMAYDMASNASAIAIIGQLSVPFSLLLAVIFLGERIRLIRSFALLLSFSGVALLSFDPAIFNERSALYLACLASFCFGLSSIMVGSLRGFSALGLQAWLALFSIPPLLLLSLVTEPGALAKLPDTRLPVYGYLLLSAGMASVIGHGSLTFLLQRYPVSMVAPLTLITPLISVACGVVFLGDALTWELVGGGFLTLAGVAIITWRNAKKAQG